MVRHLDINYVFKHPFEKVTRAYFKKYSCGKETNVTAITVLEHKIDPETAEEYVVRRGDCVNVLPGILRKFCPFGKIEVEEEAWLNKKEKYLRLHCYNLTWSKYASLEEFSCYRTCENNPDWAWCIIVSSVFSSFNPIPLLESYNGVSLWRRTIFEQRGTISVFGIGSLLGGMFETFAYTFFQREAEKKASGGAKK
ncbi:PRELI domain-containing protein 2-like isoform X2 [Montipora capricornis]|uniref:PRELI domain-containing protein 2-like isoform X2 n=1 Tax=Montipora capricornis TaxID=246305 RepID=UPI0035F1069A